MPLDERPCDGSKLTNGGWSCLSCGERYCTGHFTEHNAICNLGTKGSIKVNDQALIKSAEQASTAKVCLYTSGCRGKQPPHYGQFITCDSCCSISPQIVKKYATPEAKAKTHMKKTAEEKIKTKEAKLKRATDLAAFLEAEALLREDTTAKHEWFIIIMQRD